MNKTTLRSLSGLFCLGFALSTHIACARQTTRAAKAQTAAAPQNAAPPANPQDTVNLASPITTEQNVVYGTVDGTSLTLDAYTPFDTSQRHPAIILIHGGGWSGGDKKFYEPMGRALAAKGFAAFSINYRLLTQAANKYPAQLDDSQRAVRWIRANAAKYHVDPQRVGALGDSAGGYLVALLGLRETRDNSDANLAKYSSKVQAVVDFYGPADFTIPPTDPSANILAIAIVTNFLGKKQADAPDLYKASSPITYVDKQAAPFLIIHGTGDPLVSVDQSQRLQDALVKAGASSTLLLAYKYGHGFLNPANPGSFGALAEDFFTRMLAQPYASSGHGMSIGTNF